MYMVDTNILSHTAPGRIAPPDVLQWMERHSQTLFLSVVTLTEVEAGIAKARRSGATRKARDLAAWLDAITTLYGNRIIMIDQAMALCAGRLIDKVRAEGSNPGLADILIAASALTLGFTVLTRNVGDFPPPVAVINPFEGLPQD